MNSELKSASFLKTSQAAAPSTGPAELLSAGYPATRPRRNRQADWSRRLMQENTLSAGDLIWPVFVADGENTRTAVESMPGVDRLSIDLTVEAAAQAADLGIPVIALFPYTDPGLRSDDGAEALNPENLVCQAVRRHKGAGARDRHLVRRGARPLYQPWP